MTALILFRHSIACRVDIIAGFANVHIPIAVIPRPVVQDTRC